MPKYRITTLVKGKNYWEVEAEDAAGAESAVYAYLEGDSSSAQPVGESFDVEAIQSVEEI